MATNSDGDSDEGPPGFKDDGAGERVRVEAAATVGKGGDAIIKNDASDERNKIKNK